MRAVPHPLLSLALAVMWLVLTGFSTGQLVLGAAVGLAAGRAYASLTPAPVRLRRPGLILRLLLTVTGDIIASNLAVAWVLVGGRRGKRRAGFVRIPLELEQRAALALLSVIVTSTPGTVWIEHDAERRELVIHVLDLVDEGEVIRTIKSRYEAPLLEIFA